MGNMKELESGVERERTQLDDVRVLCKVDISKYDLDVSWTSGALFHFESGVDAELWAESQSQHVRGTFHLKENTPGTEPLEADYYLHYRPPD